MLRLARRLCLRPYFQRRTFASEAHSQGYDGSVYIHNVLFPLTSL